jgi:hypothetical protein
LREEEEEGAADAAAAVEVEVDVEDSEMGSILRIDPGRRCRRRSPSRALLARAFRDTSCDED